MIVMGPDTYSEFTLEISEELYAEIKTEQNLADIFAIVSNKFWIIEDDEYNYEVDTEEYIKAYRITDEWEKLLNRIESAIFEILKSEGVVIPDKGQITVLEPFMKRNGYIFDSGWWVKE